MKFTQQKTASGACTTTYTSENGRFSVWKESATSWRLTDSTDRQEVYFTTLTAAKQFAETKEKFELRPEDEEKIHKRLKEILHCARDTMRLRYSIWYRAKQRGEEVGPEPADPRVVKYDIRVQDHAQAYGFLDSLVTLGFIQRSAPFGGNPRRDLQSWLWQAEKEVLEEENFDGDRTCPTCYAKYHRDDARLL